MDDAKRTFRYVLPGTCAAGHFLVLWVVFGPRDLLTAAVHAAAANPAIPVIGAIVASGALGYLGSQFYFAGCWPLNKWFRTIEHVWAAGQIRMRDPPWNNVPEHGAGKPATLGKAGPTAEQGSWIVLNTWWHLRRSREDSALERVHERATNQGGHILATGTLAYSIALAGLAWTGLLVLYILNGPMHALPSSASAVTPFARWLNWACELSPWWLLSFLGSLALTVAVESVLYRNYKSTRTLHRGLVDTAVDRILPPREWDVGADGTQEPAKPEPANESTS